MFLDPDGGALKIVQRRRFGRGGWLLPWLARVLLPLRLRHCDVTRFGGGGSQRNLPTVLLIPVTPLPIASVIARSGSDRGQHSLAPSELR
jgi:hypothetical protein